MAMTRANITDHASNSPATRTFAPPDAVPSSRLRRAKVNVTAVDETNPPHRPVITVPRPAPSQRMAT